MMKGKLRKALALLMLPAICLLLVLAPLQAFANETAQDTQSEQTDTSAAQTTATTTTQDTQTDTSAAEATTPTAQSGQKNVLFINSYSYEFDTVPPILSEVSSQLSGVASIQYLFMDEKHEDDAFATQQLETELDVLTAQTHYDLVILGDDAAFDFAISHRDRYFSGIPLVYEDVNSIDKAEQYADDPLVTGIVEAFPMKETIEVARQLMPNATRVVVINDDSVSAQGSTQQALAEKADFPDLDFETFDCSQYTPEEIQEAISQYGDETILLYTVFNTDSLGNRYTIAQGVKLVSDAARVPIFRADETGVGDGLIGGYTLSYESIGKQTAQLALEVLDGDTEATTTPYLIGESRYLFDAKVMERYGISKSQMPSGSTFLNDEPSFMERYGTVLVPAIIITAAVIILMLLFYLVRKRRMQREIERSNAELKVAAAENLAKTAFISRMSHDIRTPLNAILGLNSLAMEEADDPDAVRGYLEKSSASGDLLLALVNNILDVSKIESGKMELASEPCSVSGFFDEIDDIFERLCIDKGIELRLEQDAGDAVILTDRTRLNQVFCNLLANAFKFTPSGGTVTFALKSTREQVADGQPADDRGMSAQSEDERKTGGQILHGDFTVADTGCGISEDFQSRMFQSFTQAEANFGQTEGSGLGLTIVKSIVELMGGTVRVESTVGEGTTFHVHLDFPLVDSDSGKPADLETSDEKVLGRLHGRHVLLVEDNALNAEIATVALEKQGMIVDRAENGQVAIDMLEKADEGGYDVVLMDNRMPVMNGLQATEAIRGMDSVWMQDIPIIAMTADAFDDDVRQFREVGMDDYLAKPLDIKKMYRTIAKYL